MYGYVYITTNLINGTQYIGKHVSASFDESYKGSGKILINAIKKYGFDNFECHIIDCVENVSPIAYSEDELNFAEAFYIKYFNCVESDLFYNLKPGGIGGSCKGLIYITSPQGEHKRVREDEINSYLNEGWIRKGPIPSEQTKLKRAASRKGIKRSKETCNKISQALIGKKYRPLSDNQKEWLRNYWIVNTNPTSVSVQCIETGKIYRSLHEAARDVGTCAPNIIRNIKGGSKTKGLSWRYIV